MKLIHLFEDETPLQSPNNLNQLKQFLSTHCQPYLVQFKDCNKPLLRGMKPAIDMFVVTTPINRTPTNTPIKFHTVADDWFNVEFGHRYRSNAVFCTGDKQIANCYGEPYWIFPIGEFKVCWSPDVHDLYHTIRDRFSFGSVPKQRQPSLEPDEKDLFKLLTEKRYIEGLLKSAINSNCEVMVACEKYLCVADDYAVQYNILEEIRKL